MDDEVLKIAVAAIGHTRCGISTAWNLHNFVPATRMTIYQIIDKGRNCV
jgi:hypothetical protein